MEAHAVLAIAASQATMTVQVAGRSWLLPAAVLREEWARNRAIQQVFTIDS
jgi:hypothetical protein